MTKIETWKEFEEQYEVIHWPTLKEIIQAVPSCGDETVQELISFTSKGDTSFYYLRPIYLPHISSKRHRNLLIEILNRPGVITWLIEQEWIKRRGPEMTGYGVGDWFEYENGVACIVSTRYNRVILSSFRKGYHGSRCTDEPIPVGNPSNLSKSEWEKVSNGKPFTPIQVEIKKVDLKDLRNV